MDAIYGYSRESVGRTLERIDELTEMISDTERKDGDTEQRIKLIQEKMLQVMKIPPGALWKLR